MSIRVAIVGVGNCACSLIQTVHLAKSGELSTGISHTKIGGYKVSDIDFVAAFDVDQRKLGKDLSDAIFTLPNCTTKYVDVPALNTHVSAGQVSDGVSSHMQDMFLVDEKCKSITVQDIVAIVRASKANVIVNYLPVGSDRAAEIYAEAAVIAGCAFVNCMPTPLATTEKWQKIFKDAGLPLLGDDVKSQIGSTAVHRALIDIITKKGITINNTYQLNIGGNTDFKNMRNTERAAGKKKTKEASLTQLTPNKFDLGVGPSDYVPHLKDNKVGYIHIEGVGLMGMPFSIEMRLQVEDSPNSAGVVINAIRSAQTAIDRKMAGAIHEANAFLFKNPSQHMNEEQTFNVFDDFVK